MSQTNDVADEIDHELAGEVKTFGVDENEKSAFSAFVEAALEEAEDMLESNLADAKAMGKTDGVEDVSEVLNPENVREVDWEATRFKGKRLRVWLRDAPVWANTADSRDFTVGDLNDRNRDVKAVVDIRPF